MRARWLLLLTFLLAACRPTPTPTAAPATATPPPLPSATPTPPTRRLILCTEKPGALNPLAPALPPDLALMLYAPLSRHVAWREEAVLLAELPSVEGGTILTREVTVPTGAPWVDTTGALRTNEGPPLRLPQMEVEFHLREGLHWSDGAPLTTDDILFAYHLAQEKGTNPHAQAQVRRSISLEAVDERTLRWIGLPGLLTAEPAEMLPPPLPAHRYRYQHWAEIANDRQPLSSGPFQLYARQEAGLILRPNPEALHPPRLDEVIVRYLPADVRQWPEKLRTGECDVLPAAQAMQVDWTTWSAMAQTGEALVWADVGPRPTFVQLAFNLAPADGHATPLAELGLRQAIEGCLDRTALVRNVRGGALLPATTFAPPAHPAFTDPTAAITSPEAAMAQLDRLGWRDEDGDGIREAHGVAGFVDGHPLSFTLHLAPGYTVPAAHIAAALELCGIGIAPETTDARLLYAADAASPLFGRTFELALYGWEATLPQVCGSWLSERIPSADNDYQGENFSGYANPAYDAACHAALSAVDAASRDAALRRAGQRLAHDLPTLFLFWRPWWFVSSPRVIGLRPDGSTGAALWNITKLEIAP